MMLLQFPPMPQTSSNFSVSKNQDCFLLNIFRVGMTPSGSESCGVMKQFFLWLGKEVVMCIMAVTHSILTTPRRQKIPFYGLWCFWVPWSGEFSCAAKKNEKLNINTHPELLCNYLLECFEACHTDIFYSEQCMVPHRL